MPARTASFHAVWCHDGVKAQPWTNVAVTEIRASSLNSHGVPCVRRQPPPTPAS